MDRLLVPSTHGKPRQKLQPRPDAKPSQPSPAQPVSLAATLSRQLKSANDLLLSWKDGLSADQRERVRLREERRNVLCHRIKTADSFQQWQAAAQELDALEGNDAWKLDVSSDDYNPGLIEQRLRALDDARLRRDIRSMMHLIRTSLSRDLAGMGNVDLYRNSYVGTKKLIERYVDSAIQTIDAVVALDHGPDSRDLLEGMLFARQSFGRSALLLSGGGTFGMTHIGVLKALFEARLLPRIISGSSAGSIVCAVMCTRTDDEIPAVLDEFPHGDLAVFEAADSSLGLLDHLRRLLTEGSWSDIDNLTRVMRGLAGDLTFQEAYNRTRRILNICVSPASIYELPRLLNYVTAPNVLIWSAVAASCSVPLFFSSSPLLVKDPVTGDHHPWNPTPQRFIDGSVDNDLPMTRLSEMFNVNHFIVSQVNPHVIPFLSKDDHLSPDAEPSRNRQRAAELDWTNTLASLAKEEALHRLQFMADVGVFPNLMTKCRGILSQKYSGDITILPEITMHDLPRLMRNPTADFMLRSSVLGERATWPKLSRIRDRCAIELALDGAVHRLRTRVVFSQSQRDLRGLGSGMATLRPKLPLCVSGQPPLADPLGTGLASRRQRRRSGGSVQIRSFGRMMMDLGITDDETADEERSEMVSRRSQVDSPPASRKPKLKRASRSHVHVPLSRMSLPVSAHQSEFPLDFDFSQPLPVTPHGPGDSRHGASDEAKLSAWAQHAESPRGTATSPTDDMETSEQGHSSDADAEQGTDESDSDPFEGQSRTVSESKHHGHTWSTGAIGSVC
ncbi:patatin-like phospholipase domain-containing protein [Hirsutella rhossiliensis]|uniref:Patatin-like phospholipase domain-containing protein n=1 Tax=Hirsutella rhossiliensis TaxID=111463 RepID=A0A9P8N0R2_9HYPO|nr:patatin-like phospholipase domain-containing protein [Hirsutella rhossiliensis]KAH0964780.1 patatin-like phospholipase domain-containing protein [Hirsutella rhossiliensis]